MAIFHCYVSSPEGSCCMLKFFFLNQPMGGTTLKQQSMPMYRGQWSSPNAKFMALGLIARWKPTVPELIWSTSSKHRDCGGYIYVCMHACMHVNINYACMYACNLSLCMYAYMYACKHVCMCAYIIYACMYACKH